jgi:hypothetical protein
MQILKSQCNFINEIEVRTLAHKTEIKTTIDYTCFS